MRPGALQPYERSLITGAPLAFHSIDDRALPELDIRRWLQPADETDRSALTHARGPVLDVGCGPGRIVKALAEGGIDVLGIDIARTAVAIAQERGLRVTRCDVFGPVPDEGNWATAVLLDGNIGIGGHPQRLLTRVRQLLTADGLVLVETHADESADERLTLRFREGSDTIGPTFMWALVGHVALSRYAAALGFDLTDLWRSDGRTFAVLRSTQRVSVNSRRARLCTGSSR